ncbi:MAG: FGGY-family carbohydrate kinase [Anaerolineales bacterium]
MEQDEIKELIANGHTSMGIELGSTRIKAVLISDDHFPIASGSHEWQNRFEDSLWTYSLDDIWGGLQGSFQDLQKDLNEKYDTSLETVGSLGFSAMMHGYLAFDQGGKLLVPFRTWRNTTTGQASKELTGLFNFNIPQRWSIAHLYQAILNEEPHVQEINFLTTLAGYVHWKLTGKKVLGIGDASGMFPIDSSSHLYDETMVGLFNQRLAEKSIPWKIQDILPEVLMAGEQAGLLTEEGAKTLDPSLGLKAGIPLAPPEGDAGTGMVATNSVSVRTGNISAGTSVFAMIVLEDPLSEVHPEIDMVTTPAGKPVAMVHSNNCTSDLNAWVEIFQEFLDSLEIDMDQSRIFEVLFQQGLTGDADCGNLLSYNYLSGEHITGLEEGRPLFVRYPDSKFNLANFMRTHLYSALGSLSIGLEILLDQEGVRIDQVLGPQPLRESVLDHAHQILDVYQRRLA